MKLAELQKLLDNPAGIEQAELELFSAIGQRLVRLPHTADLNTLTDCTCGLLLVDIPRKITVQRAYVVPARIINHPTGAVCAQCRAEIRLHDNKTPCSTVVERDLELRHAHAAHATTGNPMCSGCFDDPTKCTHNTAAEVCDAPEPVGCMVCSDPVLPGDPMCATCTPGEPQWDKDHYSGC
jgi:hypothetical protein